jgi:hypothetical protein
MIDGVKFKITGSFLGPFEEIAERMPRVEKYALYKAAAFLRDEVRKSIISNVPKSTVRNPKYNDTMADAARFTRVDGASLTVHALGTPASGSGTYRTRFFEAGTVERFHKKRNGIKLNKKKSVGHITGTHFFESAIEANRSTAQQIMADVITKYVQEAFKNKK